MKAAAPDHAATRAGTPLFMYLAWHEEHDPHQASRDNIARFDGTVRSDTYKVTAAQIWTMDVQVGRVVDALNVTGMLSNAVVSLSSDNGGPLDHANNWPHRGGKHTVYEGGIRTPFIAHWPGVIKPGLTEQVGHIIDISATFRDITGAKYPGEILGNRTKPPVGKSLLPVFKGNKREPHAEIYWHFNRANALRQGDLKVVRAGKAWELYDLKADPTETNNLAKERPEKTAELAKMWEDWREDYKNKPN